MLVFFSISGIWQVFGWQHGEKGVPPGVLAILSTIHTGHLLKPGLKPPPNSLTSEPLQFFAAIMGVCLAITIILGVVMAFRYGRGTLALASLAAGIFLPLGIILIFGTNH